MQILIHTVARASSSVRRLIKTQSDPDAGSVHPEWALMTGAIALVVVGIVTFIRWL